MFAWQSGCCGWSASSRLRVDRGRRAGRGGLEGPSAGRIGLVRSGPDAACGNEANLVFGNEANGRRKNEANRPRPRGCGAGAGRGFGVGGADQALALRAALAAFSVTLTVICLKL